MKHLVLTVLLLTQIQTRADGTDWNQRLLDAVDRGAVLEAKDALAQGAMVDSRSIKGLTPLCIAARKGHLELVKLLDQHGADLNTQSLSAIGSTPLLFSLDGGNFELIQYLIARGARVELDGRNGTSPLCFASSRGQMDAVKLLLSKGADINRFGMHDTTGRPHSPMTIAAANGHLDIVRFFLSKGAVLEAKTSGGDTPLMDVARRPYPEILKFYIEKGAKVGTRTPKGHSALIYAAYNGEIQNVRLLLAAGADPFVRATDEPDLETATRTYSAVSLARQQGHPEVVALLLDAEKRTRLPVVQK